MSGYRIVVNLDATPEQAVAAGATIRDALRPHHPDVGTITLEAWLYDLYHHTPASPLGRPASVSHAAEHVQRRTDGKRIR